MKDDTLVYTHWQASLRSGLGVAVVLIGSVLTFAGPINAESTAQRVLFLAAFILGSSLYALIVAISFRVGMRLSGRARVGLNVVIVAPLIYIGAFAAIAYASFAHPGSPADVTSGREALIKNVVVPTAKFLLALVLLPALTAYGTARFLGGGQTVA